MDWATQIKEAHVQGGPSVVSVTVSRIMREAASIDGKTRYDERHIIPVLVNAGLSDLVPILYFVWRLQGEVSYWDATMRERSDTPTKQIRSLLQLLKIHWDHRNAPDEFHFLFETVSWLMDATIADFNAAREAREFKSGPMWSLAKLSNELAQEFKRYNIDGPNIRKFHQYILLAKLAK